MDERQLQVEDRGCGHRVQSEVHAAASWGLETAGGREHERLLAQGHYRCSDCRRADANEMNAGLRRMR